MLCQNCGHQQESGRFCGKCGTKLERPTGGQPSVSVQTEPWQGAEQSAAMVQHGTAGQSGDAETQLNANGNSPVQAEDMAGKTEPPTNGQAAITDAGYEGAAIQATGPASQMQQNAHVEKVKETSKVYWSYYLQYLKSPSRIFANQEREFVNSLISIGLFAVLVALAAYNAAPRTGLSGVFRELGPSFPTILVSTVISMGIFLGVVTLAMFLINKFFGPDYSYRSIISTYGAHMAPVLLLTAVSLLLLILKSYVAGNVLLMIALCINFVILPLYIIAKLLNRQSRIIDPLYGFLSYMILVGILFSIVFAILADSLIGGILDSFVTF